MIKEFEPHTLEILRLVEEWMPVLSALPAEMVKERINNQSRTIKQIVGHMIDSASNNTHRIVHLQHRESPLWFPNYATHGNNDRWITIQNYQEEEWNILIHLWKYSNIHLVHVIGNVDPSKLENQWQYTEERLISLKDMIMDYLPHLRLHLGEIEELME